MNKRSLLLIPAAAALASCGTEVEEKPNIIFILADDMGYGDVSFLDHNSKLNTVHLDKMASEGAVLTDAHSSSAVSTPTRYGVLTGRYNWRSTLKSGVLFGYNKTFIPAERSTMATMLGKAGYTTAGIGKWHLGWSWNNIDAGQDKVDFSKPITNGPTERGFDYFYGFCGSLDMPPYVYVENDMPTAVPDHVTEQNRKDFPLGWWRKGPTSPDFVHEQVLPNLVSRACDYISEKSKGDEPFFLYLPLPAPHTPILPTEEFRGRSGLGDYGDFVLMVDEMVGRIFTALEKAGCDENTLVVFTTDNGCSPAADIDALIAQDHYPNSIYRGHKADLYDGGHRVPCLVRWPAKIKHHTVDQTICQTDFYATFAALAGYEMEDCEGEDSYDISKALLASGNVETIREATIHHSIKGDFTIRKGDWKLLMSGGSGGWSYPKPDDKETLAKLPPVQLYNMATDPSETTNLCNERPEIVEELKALLIKYIADGRSTKGAPQQNDGPYPWNQIKEIIK
ncbi:MAG: arylsulfatase [Rikenellaceae bacterium]